jgi:YVTN family beta-propeller protein
MRQTGSVPLDKMPRALNLSPDGRKLYFTLAGSDAVQVLDTSSNRVTKQVPVGASPHHPLFSPDGGMALVVSQGPGSLYFINPSRDVVSGNVKVGTLPHWIALADGGTRIYVTNEGSNDVSVVDAATRSVVTTIPVGNAPRKIIVQPSASPAGAGGAPVQAVISGFAFPDAITIGIGQAVRWTNTDPVPHTVSGDDGTWGSGDIAAGKSYSVTFLSAGTFPYHCGIHPAMQGTVVVQPRM